MQDKDAHFFLTIMLQCVGEAQEFIVGIPYEEFIKDTKTMRAVERAVEITGQAFRDARECEKNIGNLIDCDISWHKVAGFRNRIAHEYFDIEMPQLYLTVKNDLPILEKALKKYLKK